MLVQRKPANWRKMTTWDDIEKSLIRNPIDLAGKTVVVQKASSHTARLEKPLGRDRLADHDRGRSCL